MFKASQLFVSCKVARMKPTCDTVDMLKIFPILNDDFVLQDLRAELNSYLMKSADVSPEIDV